MSECIDCGRAIPFCICEDSQEKHKEAIKRRNKMESTEDIMNRVCGEACKEINKYSEDNEIDRHYCQDMVCEYVRKVLEEVNLLEKKK
jgi:hypothetical protein